MARRFLLGALLALLLTAPASAEPGCVAAVLRDWSEDGRVEPTYAAPCYEEAIDSLPSDLRDYTNAEEAITRALQSAVRTGGLAPVADDVAEPAGATSEPPIALVAAAALGGAVLVAGGVAYATRRRRDSSS